MRFWRKWQNSLLILVMMLALITAGCSAPSTGQDRGKQDSGQQSLEIKVFDIGQGDSILIRTANEVVLVDTGDVSTREKLISYIKNEGITTIDKVIITHPHADHLGGMSGILNNFVVKQIIDSGLTTTTSLYRQYLTTVQKKNISFQTVNPGSQIDIGGGVILKFMAPEKPLITNSELNNNAIILKLIYGNFSMLLPSDVEREGESRVLKAYGTELKSNVLKAGHHGSSTSSTPAFLKAVAPESIIISVGKDNDYHHPHPSVMKRYTAIKSQIYRTDTDGTVTITSDGQNYNITKEK
ncbi:ComE operon protein 3 [bioreactor metagenome]|uniref:ComE operon protein 3 n=1 Tax=bioreactor metagenome TaxID=1076179 RepID=A0A644TFG7_9ZZZZ|nr:ComEC/Rec2 family competence protein [Negativicutes bacterium]